MNLKKFIEEYNKNPKRCLECNKIIPYERKENKFCSLSCGAIYNNRVKYGNREKYKNCLNCGKLFKIKYKSKTDFCSATCKHNYNFTEFIQKWKKGEITGNYSSGGIHEYLREYLLKKYNYECAECGWGIINEHTETIPLEVHHIDGNPDNNKEENLVVLCPCCHSLTKTQKGANVSKRSLYRAQYKGITQEKHKEYKKRKFFQRTCQICGTNITGSLYCRECLYKHRREHFPSIQELYNAIIKSNSMSELGTKFGINLNSMKKRLKHYNLTTKFKELKEVAKNKLNVK